jgi:hypothetical protein
MSSSRRIRRGRESGISLGPTRSHSSPKNSRRGCLCLNQNTYSKECCKGYLMNQGIGKIQSTIVERGAFSSGFSDGFDIQVIR